MKKTANRIHTGRKELRKLLAAVITVGTAANGSRKTFTVGEGNMTIDTQEFTLTWQLRIDAGAGKVVKKGAGTLSVKFSPYNTGGMEIAEGTARLESGDQRIVNGPISVTEGATLEIASGNTAPYHATAVTFEDGAKLKLQYSAGQVIPVKSPSFALEGQLDMSFGATLGPGARTTPSAGRATRSPMRRRSPTTRRRSARPHRRRSARASTTFSPRAESTSSRLRRATMRDRGNNTIRATTIPLSPTCCSRTRTTSPAARCASRSARA